MKTTKSKFVAYVLHLSFGYLGLHRFYLGKAGTGFLYFCTFGLLGMGWIYDLFALSSMVDKNNLEAIEQNKPQNIAQSVVVNNAPVQAPAPAPVETN